MANETTEAQIVGALSTVAIGVRHAEEGAQPFIALPEGYSVHNLTKTLAQPSRCYGSIEVRDAAGFITVVAMHQGPSTVLYRTVEPPRFTAVFNDSTPSGGPGWADHTATYDCPLSVEWRTWAGMDKKVMSQAEFAQFIEDNLPDIVNPTAGEMLEISRTLQAKKKVNFASAIRLDNGQNQFTYEETTAGSAGAKGQLSVPEVFTLGITVFEGGEAYAVRARLRYRISEGGALAMWYHLERPHKIIQDAVESLRKQIETATGFTTVNGARRPA